MYFTFIYLQFHYRDYMKMLTDMVSKPQGDFSRIVSLQETRIMNLA